MNRDLEKVFDDLKRQADFLNNNPDRDNESQRHDTLVYPILTHPLLLGWDKIDIIPQSALPLNKEVIESYIWKNATPQKKRPDMIIAPIEFTKTVAVVEEKKKQTDTDTLRKHDSQLIEYQYLFKANWGLLTDGEKWIVKSGLEDTIALSSLDDFKRNLSFIKEMISRNAIIERLIKYNTTNICIIFKPKIIIKEHTSDSFQNLFRIIDVKLEQIYKFPESKEAIKRQLKNRFQSMSPSEAQAFKDSFIGIFNYLDNLKKILKMQEENLDDFIPNL